MIELLGLGAVAGVIPVYLGIGAALLLGKVLPRSWEGGLIGIATGVLVYLFFDLMHEAVELSGARDVLSWAVFLGSLGASLIGLVALESSQIFGGRPAGRLLEPGKPVSMPLSPSAAIWRPARQRSHWRSNIHSSMLPSASIHMK